MELKYQDLLVRQPLQDYLSLETWRDVNGGRRIGISVTGNRVIVDENTTVVASAATGTNLVRVIAGATTTIISLMTESDVRRIESDLRRAGIGSRYAMYIM